MFDHTIRNPTTPTTTPTTTPSTTPTGRRRPRRVGRLAVAAAAGSVALAALPSTGTTEAYNSGVKSITFTPASESCVEGQALPCPAGAGIGEANVLRVTQSVVHGYHQYNGLEGTSSDADALWLAVDFGAECRVGHDMTAAQIDTRINDVSEGVWLNIFGTGDPALLHPPLPDGRVMPTERRAVVLPVERAFQDGLIGHFADAEDVFESGEAEIQRRIDDGMTAAEARGVPYQLNTWLSLAAEVVCDLPGLAQPRYQRQLAHIPLTIEYVPVDVPPAAGGAAQGPADESVPAQVTQAEISVLPDPADPCTLHLSGVITTNAATDVEYRWINQYGQPSNTYTLAIDGTQVGYVHRTVQVPHADVPGPITDKATSRGGSGPIGDKAVFDDGAFTGTFELEVLSPNVVSNADGFDVPYCTTPGPVQVNPAVGEPIGGRTAGGRPTHG